MEKRVRQKAGRFRILPCVSHLSLACIKFFGLLYVSTMDALRCLKTQQKQHTEGRTVQNTHPSLPSQKKNIPHNQCRRYLLDGELTETRTEKTHVILYDVIYLRSFHLFWLCCLRARRSQAESFQSAKWVKRWNYETFHKAN